MFRIALPFVFSLFLSLTTSHFLRASFVTIPPGLQAGDAYRLVFVTSGVRKATSSDISDYNAFVTAQANMSSDLAALGTSWTAIASTSTVDARDNTSTFGTSLISNAPVFRGDGERVVVEATDLWKTQINDRSFDLENPIILDQYGLTVTSPTLVFSGTLRNGIKNSALNVGPLGGSVTTTGVGRADLISNRWIAAGAVPLTDERSFYAISGLLFVPNVIPEPSSVVLFIIYSSLLSFCRIQRRCEL